MAVAEALWRADTVQRLADACLKHPFVQGIADGSLDKRLFQSFIAQDAYFLRAFADAYGEARARCTDSRHRAALGWLKQAALDELAMHDDYAQEWGVDLSLFSTPSPSTLAYTRFLYEAASGAGVHRFIANADQHPNSNNNTVDAVINRNNPLGNGVAQALAALTPCMRLYVFLGKAIGEQQPHVQHAYSKWIETYSAPEFEAQATLLERLLDDVASAEGVSAAVLQPVYERAMRLEHNFFEANWLNAHK